MAITYHAGRRIQGSSDAVANWTDANGTNGTGAGQYDSSNTTGDDSFNYDTLNDRVDFSVNRISNTPNCMMKDLTSSTNGIGTALSTTDFRIRFKIHWTNWDDKGDVAFYMGLSSFSRSEAINGSNSNDIRKPSGGDSIQLVFDNARLGGASNCWNWLTFGYAENTSTTTNFGGDSTHHALDLEVPNTILSSGNYNCGIPANASTYFCEIIRSGGTTLTLNISKTAYGLSDVSGASNSALGKTTSGTCTSSFGTTRPLKYLFLGKTGGVSSYNNKIEGYMSDIQVQSTGTSSIDRGQLTDVQAGSRFEETDTRKMYHYVNWGSNWYLEGTTIPPQPSSRGLFAGGEVSTDTIDYITIATAGNATDFGNLTLGRHNMSAVSSGTRAVFIAGTTGTYTDTMDYVTVATTGNATDFGDTLSAIQSGAGVSSETRGVTGGGNTSGGVSNVIQYITIDTLGNATTFGVNLTQARHSPSGVSSGTRGVWMGGFGSGNVSTMDYITIATTGTCTNFGNLLASRRAGAGCGSKTRGLIGGGYEGGHVNTIEYITIASTGNSTDFGDLTRSNNVLGACSSDTRGVWGGGNNTNVNTIDYVTIDATGNATDFGDLTAGRAGVVGTDGY